MKVLLCFVRLCIGLRFLFLLQSIFPFCHVLLCFYIVARLFAGCFPETCCFSLESLKTVILFYFDLFVKLCTRLMPFSDVWASASPNKIFHQNSENPLPFTGFCGIILWKKYVVCVFLFCAYFYILYENSSIFPLFFVKTAGLLHGGRNAEFLLFGWAA